MLAISPFIVPVTRHTKSPSAPNLAELTVVIQHAFH